MGKTRAKVDGKKEWHRPALAVAVIVAAAVIPFLPALRAPFLFDDINTIVQNPAIHEINLDAFFSDPTTFSVKPGNWPYRPLAVALNAMLFELFGLAPGGWHGFQFALHALNSLLVMIMARRVFGLSRGALAAGLLFAIDPLQSQAVIYISARTMVAGCTWALLAVLLFERALRADHPRTELAASIGTVAAALLAFFSSEGSLALVIWLALAAYALGVKPWERRPRAVLLAVAAGVAVFLLAKWVTAHGPAFTANPRVATGYTRLESVSISLRFPFVAVLLFALPLRLNVLHHAVAASSALEWRFWAPALGTVAVAALLVVLRRRRTFAAGMAWYFGSLLPALIVPLNIAWAEHRSYLALPGLCVALAAGLEGLERMLAGQRRSRLAVAALIVVLACLGALTWQRAQAWRSERALFMASARAEPDYDVPWSFLAEEARKRVDYETALRYLDRTLALNPNFADAYGSRSAVLMAAGRYREAAEAADRAVELDPQNPTYRNNFGMALWRLGYLVDAEKALAQAIKLMPPNDPNRRIFEKNLMLLQEEIHQRGAGPGP
jgi:protein O-mannosyl-transferase